MKIKKDYYSTYPDVQLLRIIFLSIIILRLEKISRVYIKLLKMDNYGH